MPTLTIDGRALEVPAGTNLIEAAKQVGIQIPHYCYHPRLSIVGQCRMCLVKIEGNPKLQAACSTEVHKDGMVVLVDDPEVRAAQEGVMEFLLINHPLDCPICDQAGECGLQDYSFKHGQAFSRFAYEEKRTYPGRERIPLGPNVLLNMNRCIQCTRCIRFTEEITGTGELGFFQRGARTEIGVFPGKELNNELSTCVVDLCPVGALTSTRFRFAERVWYLEKVPSICTGCDIGCNITLEHRAGRIRRYKPRANPEVNDYWMCDYGRSTAQRYDVATRLSAPRRRPDLAAGSSISWGQALDLAFKKMLDAGSSLAFLGSPYLTNEEAFLLALSAELFGTAHRTVWTEEGPERVIPNAGGAVRGREAAPNRRGAELAGLVPAAGGLSAEQLLRGEGAAESRCLFVADGDPGSSIHAPETVDRLRTADTLVVMGWAETPLTAVADLALPCATHAEKQGTFVNVQGRMQRFERAFPPPGEARPAVDILADLLSRLDPRCATLDTAQTFRRLATSVLEMPSAELAKLPAHGFEIALQVEERPE